MGKRLHTVDHGTTCRRELGMGSRFAVVAALATASIATAATDWEAGVAAFRAGKLDDAAAAFERHVDRAPDQYQGHLMLGQILLQQGNTERAVGHLSRANELEPGNASVVLPLATALQRAERHPEACAALGPVDGATLDARQQVTVHKLQIDAECSDDPLPHLEQIARLRGDAVSWAKLGSEARKLGRTEQAVAAFDRAVELAPDDVKISRNHFAALAQHVAALGDAAPAALLDRLVASAQRMVKLEPNVEHRLQLAEAQLLSDAAADALTTLAGVSGNWRGDWLRARALSSETLQRHDEALAALERALPKADPAEVASLHALRGYSLTKLRRYDQAVAAYQTAGDDEAADQVRAQEQVAAENAAIDDYNKELKTIEQQQRDIDAARGSAPGGPPPR